MSQVPTSVVQEILFGGGFAFAAVIQPGPLQAFLLSRAASTGWRRTLPAAFSPLLSDGPIALLVLLVLGRLPPTAQDLLRGAGGLLLLYLAWGAFSRARSGAGLAAGEQPSAPRTLLQATTVNLLNPNPYLGWALVLGPAMLAAWRHGPLNAVVLVGAFYGVMVVGLVAFILLAGTAHLLPPRAQRALGMIAAAVLAALGVYLLVASVLPFVEGS
jgi:threonine/homoserine/homoserine lactone efflux protein